MVDHDAIFGDVRERDALVGHAADGSGVAGDGLDSNAWIKPISHVLGIFWWEGGNGKYRSGWT